MSNGNRNTVSLNKFISETGICSRREADQLMLAGRVTLNGELAKPGNRVGQGDRVEIDGQPILSRHKPDNVYLALNKPVGIICTTDQKVRGNIVDFVNYPKRIFHIGRLDKPSEGLILLTNDGDIVNEILRSENAHEKEYEVTVDREITDQFIQKMEAGVPVLNTITKPCTLKKISKFTFRIILTQGLNRQIRRMCEHLGYKVTKLKRIRIMNIGLGILKSGEWRYLSKAELKYLFAKINQ